MIVTACLLSLALLATTDGGAVPERTKTSNPAPPPLLTPVVNGVRADPFVPRRLTTDELDLRPAKDGSGDLIYDSSGFVARVTPDGTVNFRDKHLSALHLLPFLPGPGIRNLPSIQSTLDDLRHGRDPAQGDDTQVNDGSRMLIPLLTRYRPDPREACRACEHPVDPKLLSVTGGFDLTDEVMRMSAQDPYRYDKAKFLVVTREMRAQKAARRYAEYVRGARGELDARLHDIACDDRRTLRERRRIIEKLRDELDGATPEAQAANGTITQFLETRFGPRDGGSTTTCPKTEDAP